MLQGAIVPGAIAAISGLVAAGIFLVLVLSSRHVMRWLLMFALRVALAFAAVAGLIHVANLNGRYAMLLGVLAAIIVAATSTSPRRYAGDLRDAE